MSEKTKVAHVIREIVNREFGENIGCRERACVYGYESGWKGQEAGCYCKSSRDPDLLQVHVRRLARICEIMGEAILKDNE